MTFYIEGIVEEVKIELRAYSNTMLNYQFSPKNLSSWKIVSLII